MNFADAKAQIKTPSASLVVPLEAFADAWTGKPAAPVCVGLRLLSNEDRQKARVVAEGQAIEMHPRGGDGWIECYNDAVKRQAVALAICDPNDVTRSHETFPYAEDIVLIALTTRGTDLIFDAVEQHEIDQSPLEQRATPATLKRLSRLLPLVESSALSGRLSRRITSMLEEVATLVDPGLVDDASDELPLVVGKQP